MSGNDLKKRIASLGLAAVIGATSGVAIEKGLNNSQNKYSNPTTNKELTVLWTGDEVKDYSFLLGGLVGRYDYLNEKESDYTKNSYYEQYYDYMDVLEYINGYQEGYSAEGMFVSYENSDYTLEEVNTMARVFEAMADGSVQKQYVTSEPDRVLEILHPEDYGKSRS